MKRILFYFLLIFPINSYAEVVSGTTGDCTWNLDTATGVLTISGNGKTDDYWAWLSGQFPEWYNYKDYITQVVVEPGCTFIGCDCFYLCDKIVSVSLPEGLTEISSSAFRGCESLNSVNIPESVTFIGNNAFLGCNMTSITIPKNVETLQGSAFLDCTNLKSVTSYMENPPAYDRHFDNVSSDCAITVPAGTRDAYIAAGWTEDIFKGGVVEMDGVADVSLDVNACEVYKGEDASVSINMNNAKDIIMVEFYMQLPDGFEIAMDEDGNYQAELNSGRSNGHQIGVARSDDGIYHFLCYSSRNNAFNYNSGELINLRLVCGNDVVAGTYEGKLMNFVISDDNLNEINPDDFTFMIEVKDFLMGDVNADTRINGLDIVEMVDKILDRPITGAFVFAAADFDANGAINGMDLVEEVSLVLSQTASGVKARKAPEKFNPDMASMMRMSKTYDGSISVGIDSADDYILSQFMLELSDGQQLKDIAAADRDHVIAFQQIDGNRYMVLCYSTRNAAFTDNNDLLRISCEGEGTVKVTDVMMVDADRKPHYVRDAEFGEATGIEIVNGSFAKPADIYSVSGALVRKNAKSTRGLGKGIYVVNGKVVNAK